MKIVEQTAHLAALVAVVLVVVIVPLVVLVTRLQLLLRKVIMVEVLGLIILTVWAAEVEALAELV